MQSSLLTMSMPSPPPSMYRGVSGSLARFLPAQPALCSPLCADEDEEDRFAYEPQPHNNHWQQQHQPMQTHHQLQSPVASPRVRPAPPALLPLQQEDPFAYDPFSPHSGAFLLPSTPVPSGRSWLHLSRHPVLHDASMATMRRVEATRDAIVEQARLIGKLKGQQPMTPRAAYILEQIDLRFTQMNVEASQLFLTRAQSQSSADEQAFKAGLTVHLPAMPAVPALARATSVKTHLPPVPPAALVDAGINLVMSASVDLDRVSSVVAASLLHVPPPAVLVSSSAVPDDCHSLDAEADAEVASMVDVKSSISLDSALVLSAPRFSPRRPLSEEIPPLQLDVQSHETRSVTSGSSDGASSAFTQRASLGPDRASPPTLMPAHASRLIQAALDDSPAAARLRRDNIHSCPVKSKPPKAVAAKDSAASRCFAPIADGGKLPPAGANMLRSQSACQRPSASPSPSPSCRRRLNFDAAPLRSDTPYKERLLLNAPLQAWLVQHLDDPFPTADEKQALSKASGLTYDQVQAWFINNRGRSLEALKAKRDASLSIALHSADAAAESVVTPPSSKKSKRVHTPLAGVAGWVAAVEFRVQPATPTTSATAVVFEAASSSSASSARGAVAADVVAVLTDKAAAAVDSGVAASAASVTNKKSAAGGNKRGKRSRA